MRDSADRPEPPTPRRATGGRAARPRFALPVDHHDERTSERIEAFLEGPVPARRSRPRQPRPEAVRRPRRLVPLDTRTDWEAALLHEDARLSRYGRAASVLVVDIRLARPGAEDRLATEVGSVIRRLARETDRVARVSQTRFHVLLPETMEPEAIALAQRVQQACAASAAVGLDGPLTIATAVASPPRGATLVEALRQAQDSLAD